MDLRITDIVVEHNTLVPTLGVQVEMPYYYQLEAPLQIGGTLMTEDGKVIGSLSERQLSRDLDMHLKPLEDDSRGNRYNEDKYRYTYQAYLVCEVSAKAAGRLKYKKQNNLFKAV